VGDRHCEAHEQRMKVTTLSGTVPPQQPTESGPSSDQGDSVFQLTGSLSTFRSGIDSLAGYQKPVKHELAHETMGQSRNAPMWKALRDLEAWSLAWRASRIGIDWGST
jgi:hypothetical protein